MYIQIIAKSRILERKCICLLINNEYINYIELDSNIGERYWYAVILI